MSETLSAIASKEGYKTLFLGKWHLNVINDISEGWNFGEWLASSGNAPTYDVTCFCDANPLKCHAGHYSNKRKLGPNYDCTLFKDPHNEQVESRNQASALLIADQFDEFANKLEATDSFLSLIFFHEPHIPYIASPQVRDYLINGPLKDLPDEHNRGRAADYFGCIMGVDDAVGQVRDTIKRLGRSEDTFMVFSSDNGPEDYSKGGYGSSGPLRGRKRSLFEGGHRVPGIVEWPQRISHNIRSNSLVSMLDVSATILEVIYQDNPQVYRDLSTRLDGKSFLSALSPGNTKFEWDREEPLVFCSHSQLQRGVKFTICQNLAIMNQEFKMVMSLNKNNWVLDRHRLYKYHETEYTTVPPTSPSFQKNFDLLKDQAHDWTSSVLRSSVRKCRFPPQDISLPSDDDYLYHDTYAYNQAPAFFT